MADHVIITRQELFERVWKEPVWKVGVAYGVTGKAIAKICEKLRVPVPGRGYWAKVAAGHKPRQLKLPAPMLGQPMEHRLIGRRTEPPPAVDVPEGPPIVVPDKLERPHPLVKGSRRLIWEAKKAPGRPLPHPARNEPCLDIGVTRQSSQRALRIMDTLIKALEARGYRVEVTTPTSTRWGDRGEASRTKVHIGEESLEFNIREQLEKYTADPESAYPLYELVPTGRLTLKIDSWGAGVRALWRDGVGQRVEDCLGDFIRSAVAIAEYWRLRHLEVERERALEEARERQRAQEQRQREELARRITEVERRAEDWAKADRLRALLAVAKARGIKMEWVTWGAERLVALERQALA